MHAVKSRAKRHAWSREEGGQYNPFGKFHGQNSCALDSRTNSLDPEMALNGTGSDLNSRQRRSPEGLESEGPSSNGISPSSTAPLTFKERVASKMPWHKNANTGKDVELSRTKSNATQNRRKLTIWSQIKATLFGSWVNVLLICVPIGIALNYTNVNKKVVFVVNFLAIIPLAGILSYSTEEISMRVGETLGGLLNASFGNAVELIVSVIALTEDQITIVQTSLIGSMLSNLLLVLGMCFFFGGINRPHQNFNQTVAQTAASLLALAIGSVLVPTAFARLGNVAPSAANITQLSRGVSVILLIVYGCYLYFQLKTHADIYNEKSEKVSRRPRDNNSAINRGLKKIGVGNGAHVADGMTGSSKEDLSGQTQHEGQSNEDEKEEEQPRLTTIGAIVSLCISTAFVGLCAEYMVSSIGAITTEGGVSPEFVGLILIPIVGNAAEHATAVTVAVKDKMDLAIGVAVGSSMQIALLVLPLIVVIGWCMGKSDMSLDFDGFLIALLFIAVLLVNYLIADGQSHWLEGILLMSLYIIIAVAAYLYPETAADVVG